MSSRFKAELRWVAFEERRALTTSTIELRLLPALSILPSRKLFLELAGLEGRLSVMVLVGELICGDLTLFDFLRFSFDRVREVFGGLGVDFSPLSSLSLILWTATRNSVIHSVIKFGVSNTRYQA